MKFIFTTHAKIRAQQRGVSEEDTRAALLSPDSTNESFKGRTTARKSLGRGTLEVIYRKAGADFIIITCYWIKEG